MVDDVRLAVHRDGLTGGLQLDISFTDEQGYGNGYRIAGPKFNGSSEELLSAKLDNRDAKEIRRYLDLIDAGEHKEGERE